MNQLEYGILRRVCKNQVPMLFKYFRINPADCSDLWNPYTWLKFIYQWKNWGNNNFQDIKSITLVNMYYKDSE
jgi:hypothetical protein